MRIVDSIPYPGEREPAPGRLRLVQRFVNTVDHEHGREVIGDPARLRLLLVDLGLMTGAEQASQADLVHALVVRNALRALALANNGVPADAGAVATREEASARGGLRVELAGGAAELVSPSAGVDGALATLVGIVALAVANGTWPRLKACQRDVCQWLFYDRSRNRSARWCQMAVCGNRTKTRAYRARRSVTQA
jgi:predicted RNA-binding Zn ribbon-like protein